MQKDAVFIRTLQEMFVDIRPCLFIAQINHVMIFSLKIVMQIAKHIYQLVIYQENQDVQLLEQYHVIFIRLIHLMILKMHPIAIHN